MISDQDITKLQTVFATKEDLADLRLEVGELKDEVGVLKDTIDNIDVKLDRFLSTIDTIRQEEAAGAVILERHTHQIQSLASHTGATLPD